MGNNAWFLMIPILVPLIGGILVSACHMEQRKLRQGFVMATVILNSVFVWAAIFWLQGKEFRLVELSQSMSLTLSLDGLGCVFAGMVAVLWPIASVYAFEYMKHEGGEVRFFKYYTMTYGVTLGVAFSHNLVTMYLFYEMLTLITLPLVMHSKTDAAKAAGRKYLVFSIGGASLAFIGMVFLYHVVGDATFTAGGMMAVQGLAAAKGQNLLTIFVITFIGFGVKAALFPFHGWLPTAGVAPTTVTALLHAVAVVKAGAFAVIRITYYLFGADVLRRTWAQNVVLLLAAFTIVLGSAKALKEQHVKRRLAYSTISNLSYILLGAALMTPLGLQAALTHMIAHAFIKITLFYCAGSIIYKAHYEYVPQMVGLAGRMPVVMGCFTIGSLALMGIPLLPAFISKAGLLTGIVELGTPAAYIGMGALLISAVLTAYYLFSIVIRAYFPGKGFDITSNQDARDPNWLMKGPLILLCIICLLLGLFPGRLLEFFADIAAGLF